MANVENVGCNSTESETMTEREHKRAVPAGEEQPAVSRCRGYATPVVECIGVAVEQGFAGSSRADDLGADDYGEF